MANVATAKQRAFARLVAQGMTKTKAYDQVYGNKGGKKGTRMVAASQESLKPAVQMAIHEFEEQMAPIEDMRAVRREMLQAIRWLATQGRDERVRLAAAIDLRNYADEREREHNKREKSRGPLTLDGFIAEIKALDAPEPVVEMEDVIEDEAASATPAEEPAAQAPNGSGPAA
jgi:hypothetical protein